MNVKARELSLWTRFTTAKRVHDGNAKRHITKEGVPFLHLGLLLI
jgi:hypothetical protein